MWTAVPAGGWVPAPPQGKGVLVPAFRLRGGRPLPPFALRAGGRGPSPECSSPLPQHCRTQERASTPAVQIVAPRLASGARSTPPSQTDRYALTESERCVHNLHDDMLNMWYSVPDAPRTVGGDECDLSRLHEEKSRKCTKAAHEDPS